MDDIKEQLFRQVNLPVEKVGTNLIVSTNRIFSRTEARDFAIRAIRLKSPLLKSRLRTLLYNHGVKCDVFEDLISELIDTTEPIHDDGNLGFISKTGDGKKGLMGNGPITYTWRQENNNCS